MAITRLLCSALHTCLHACRCMAPLPSVASLPWCCLVWSTCQHCCWLGCPACRALQQKTEQCDRFKEQAVKAQG